MTVEASLSKCAHPPRSNRPRSSSSGPPGPCITPSTETCVVVVSFMIVIVVPFSLVWSSFARTGPHRSHRRARVGGSCVDCRVLGQNRVDLADGLGQALLHATRLLHSLVAREGALDRHARLPAAH